MKATTNFALPYPESGDHTRTWEYWQGLAEAVDSLLASKFAYVGANGSIMITHGGQSRPLPYAMFTWGGNIAGTGANLAGGTVNFPAGRFTFAPACMANVTNASNIKASVESVGTGSAAVWLRTVDGSLIANGLQVPVTLIAVQMLPTGNGAG